MEFNFNIEQTIRNNVGNGIYLLDGMKGDRYSQRDFALICHLLDEIGRHSAIAQDLKAVITNGAKFFGSDHRIYLKCDKNLFIGFIKVGVKNLFIYNEIGEIVEISPLCVLDFYTYEGCQRKGYGNELYRAMINNERIEPRKLGYDRPSFKFLNFLKKYYGLEEYIPQNNNYVVFNDYFKKDPLPNSSVPHGNRNNFSNLNQRKLGYHNDNYEEEYYENKDTYDKPQQKRYGNISYGNSSKSRSNVSQPQYRGNIPMNDRSSKRNGYYGKYEQDNMEMKNDEYEFEEPNRDNRRIYERRYQMPSNPYNYSKSSSEYGGYGNFK